MLIALVLAALAAASPAPSQHPSTVAFEIAERDLFPESVAYDPGDGSFYVGSMHLRKIVRVDGKGRVSEFTAPKQDGLWAVIGMKIDGKRRELWANSCHPPEGSRPPVIEPENEGAGRGAVYRYDLRSGKLAGRYEAADPAAKVCFNDLVLAPSGDVWLTAGMDGIWRLRNGEAKIERFLAVPDDYMNGIEISEDGRTVFVAAHVQGVSTLDPATGTFRKVAVPAGGATLQGIDGLYLHRGALVGIQNGTAKVRVVRAPLAPDFSAAKKVEVLDEENPRFAVPTTGVVVGDVLYYVGTSQLDSVDPKTNTIPPPEKLRPNLILKLKLAE